MKEKDKNYFFIIPIAITFLIYLPSLFYGFRVFDEDQIIQEFYTKKTFSEYVEKFFLVNLGGATEAHGFTFSSVKNVHVSVLGIPLLYLISFLFQAKPFLFHLWGLILHLIALFFFSNLCFRLTHNKQIALVTSFIWSFHPINVESIIWATNWPQLLGACFYFYTLNKIVFFNERGVINQTSTILFITVISIIQILFTEHTITIPFAIFLTTYYLTNKLKLSLKLSSYPFIFLGIYTLLRFCLASKGSGNLIDTLQRIIFLSPQTFLDHLKLIFFPKILTIDQLDHLTLDLNNFGSYHLLSIFVLFIYTVLIVILKNKFKELSFGLVLYLICLLPFLQIIPLYSIVGERYNYLGLSFLIFGIICFLFKLFLKLNKLLLVISILISIFLGIRSYFRILDWKSSPTLFLSTINSSKSLLKKGIWTYNLALTQQNKDKKEELLNLSCNLLKLFIETNTKALSTYPKFLSIYEIDTNSLLAKAAHRIATNHEILGNKEHELDYLLKALGFANENSQMQAQIYKNLGTFYFQKNDFIKALDYYKKSYLISPYPTIDYAVSLCYLKLNNLQNYEAYLKKAVSVISPYNISPFKTYGQFLELQKNDSVGAIKYYKIATLLENNPESYILLSTLYLKLNQIENASKYISRGLHSFPENPSLSYLNGTIKISKGKTSEGINDLIKAVNNKEAANDIRIESCNILVNIFLKQNKPEEARKYNEIALSINPKNKEALIQYNLLK